MIRNYFIITFRNFIRNKNYTFINVLGLSIGITTCIIIFLLIVHELSFDKFHSKYKSIFRVVQDSRGASGISNDSATPYPLANALRNDFKDIPLITQVHFEDEVLLKVGKEKQKVKSVLFADSLFFKVFDFEVLSGNPGVELGQPGKVFLTKSLADKILKEASHSTLKINNELELEIAGIIADPPPTSHLSFTMVVSMPSFSANFLSGLPIDEWGMTAAGFTYLALPEDMTATTLEEQLPAFVKKYYDQDDAARKSLRLQALADIHFSNAYTENPGLASNAKITDLIVMAILGGFILIIACINFINLATALAIKKSKEIGIRKTLGAKREQLTSYFLGETFLLTLLAVILSLCATEWLLPAINQFLEKQIDLNLFTDFTILSFLIALIIFTTLLSGFYPALILSNYNPAVVLKNKMSAQGSAGSSIRKVLVVFQFLIAQVLIIGTLIVAEQMKYFRSKPLGFNSEAVINVPMPEVTKEIMESFRVRLEENHAIENVSFSLAPPTSENSFRTNYFLSERGDGELHSIAVKPVDFYYKDTYGIKLKAGRWFTESEEKSASFDIRSKQHHVYVINESAAKKLGFYNVSDVIGKYITTGLNRINAEVVGVVEDFHVTSLHDKIEPVVLLNFPYFYGDAGIRLNTQNLNQTIQLIDKHWSALYPEYYFEYKFLDQELNKLYRKDERTFTLFTIFAGISIFIGCLGLYGLISFMANQKMKEVGVRKVMGATVGNIVMLFSKEFIKLIGVSFLIAAPLAWYSMNEWLQSFAYHIDIHWSVFAIGILLTMIISLATASYQSIRAAVANPVDTLRSE